MTENKQPDDKTKDIIQVDWQAELAEREIEPLDVGDWLINDDGNIYKVVGFGFDSYKKKCVICEYSYRYSDGTTGTSTRKVELKELDRREGSRTKYRKMYADIDTLFNDAVNATYAPDDDEDEKVDTTSTGLVLGDNQALVNEQKNILRAKQDRFEIMEWVMKRKMMQLREKATLMARSLKYTRQVLRLMELFLGVYEQIETLREGKPAPDTVPINIRQMVLYMDEEVGTIEFFGGQRGIDFRSVDEFDKWLLQDQKHVDLVIPEAKGIVALKPSRQNRKYHENPFFNSDIDKNNSKLYILIRNGQQLYRIYTSMFIGDRLFPSQAEMDEIQAKLMDATEMSYSEEKARDAEMTWRYKAVMLEGLIQRTHVLRPLPSEDVSLFKSESFESGDITLIRDAETTNLPDGHMSFKDWRKKHNQNIGKGSRVVLFDVSRHYMQANSWKERNERDRWEWRFGEMRRNWLPSRPPDGVYQIVDATEMRTSYWDKEETLCFKIMYMPENRMRDYEFNVEWQGEENVPEPRRQGFWLRWDDDFMLNYDAFDLDEIGYFVANRIERPNYLSVLPQLFQLRDRRLAEIEEERKLVEALVTRYEFDEEDVWEAVDWWKRKVNIQRPIAEDESKAWRMIRKRLGGKEVNA